MERKAGRTSSSDFSFYKCVLAVVDRFCVMSMFALYCNIYLSLNIAQLVNDHDEGIKGDVTSVMFSVWDSHH